MSNNAIKIIFVIYLKKNYFTYPKYMMKIIFLLPHYSEFFDIIWFCFISGIINAQFDFLIIVKKQTVNKNASIGEKNYELIIYQICDENNFFCCSIIRNYSIFFWNCLTLFSFFFFISGIIINAQFFQHSHSFYFFAEFTHCLEL